MTAIDRRKFLKAGTAATVGGLTGAGPLSALLANAAGAEVRPVRGRRSIVAEDNGGYGPLSPTRDLATGETFLALPEGFSYTAFGQTGEMGSDGFPTPDRHDGMAAFPGPGANQVRLVRNHERGYSPVPFEGSGEQPLVGNPDFAYDRNSGGACTTLLFDTASMRLVDSFISINGTSVNCAGGLTPQGSWLTCEETTNGPSTELAGAGFQETHGYIFEVPAEGGVVTDPQPLRPMGRFAHEAVAIDPATGSVYETEDNGDESGFYRFLPARPDNLAAGGKLQMLAIRGRSNFDTRTGQTVGRPLPAEWVEINDPDPAGATENRSAVFEQGAAAGGATFARLEGAWFGDGRIYFNSTSGGEAGLGQVWEYRPLGGSSPFASRFGGLLTLIFESPGASLLDSPDNITVTPRGGLALCEDGDDEQFVRGISVDGRIFDFALNLVSENEDKEFAGACYSPDGTVLFVNIQTPGISFAITGPFDKGSM
ncbi:MAG: PhoX family protein [Actinomycetota bacterium]|nr:PhoX family protein [Actinomycetota bacterium]